MMNLGNGNIKTKVVNALFKGWTQNRSEIVFSKKTFNEMWKEKNRK